MWNSLFFAWFWHDMILHDMILHDMILHDMILHGMILHGFCTFFRTVLHVQPRAPPPCFFPVRPYVGSSWTS